MARVTVTVPPAKSAGRPSVRVPVGCPSLPKTYRFGTAPAEEVPSPRSRKTVTISARGELGVKGFGGSTALLEMVTSISATAPSKSASWLRPVVPLVPSCDSMETRSAVSSAAPLSVNVLVPISMAPASRATMLTDSGSGYVPSPDEPALVTTCTKTLTTFSGSGIASVALVMAEFELPRPVPRISTVRSSSADQSGRALVVRPEPAAGVCTSSRSLTGANGVPQAASSSASAASMTESEASLRMVIANLSS